MADDTEFATLHAEDFRKGMLDRDHAIADLTRERDELREKLLAREAEVEGLEAARAGDDIAIGELRVDARWLRDQITSLDAKVERLKAAVVEIGAAHVAAQAEVERLAATLEQIGQGADEGAAIARRTLA